MSALSMSPCVRVLQVLESSADTCSQSILALCWSNAKEKKILLRLIFHQRCWVPCCLFLICSTIFWGHAVLPRKYTEHSPEDPHGPLLAKVKAGWKKKNSDRSCFPLERDVSRQNVSWEHVTLSKFVTEKCQAATAARKTYSVPFFFQFVHSQLVFFSVYIYIWAEGTMGIDTFYPIFTLLHLIF